ncbi:MAG: hypothetical protein RLZZ507_4562 [Cyanobacteriota bacterium]|jgi:hypothetical protein
MDTNDDLRKNIDDIKSDISMIKTSIATLSLEFNTHIQNHSVTSNNPANTAVLVHDVKTDISIENNVDINDTDNSVKSIESKLVKPNLIDYPFIENNDNNKSLIEILEDSNKKLYPFYKKNFLKFCDHSVSLVEEVIKIFLEQKFINIDIDDEDNDKLVKACNLVEKKYQNKNWDFPHIYIPKHQYNPHKRNPDDYRYISNRNSYLSLPYLTEGKIVFTLELSFVILYGEIFYKEPYTRCRNVSSKTSSQALKRPSAKLPSSHDLLNKEFYYLIDDAREFRNVIEHNKNNSIRRNKKLQELLSKKQYLQNTENNYDGILEAVNWLIRQMYIDMTKN